MVGLSKAVKCFYEKFHIQTHVEVLKIEAQLEIVAK